MDGSRFDDVTRSLATGSDRRRFVRGLAAGLGGALGLGALRRGEAKPGKGGGNPSGRCPDGYTNCRGICVDLTDNPNHCGICSLQCSSGETCCGGVCTPTASFQTDEANCGACGNVCAPSDDEFGVVCIDGACVDCVQNLGARCGSAPGGCCPGLVCTPDTDGTHRCEFAPA